MEWLIDLLAHLDWWERLAELLFCIREPGSVRFAFKRRAGFSGYIVERMLRTYGVKIHGRAFDEEHLYFRVNPRQAHWAEYLMMRWRVPLAGKPVEERNARWAARHEPGSLPPAWED